MRQGELSTYFWEFLGRKEESRHFRKSVTWGWGPIGKGRWAELALIEEGKRWLAIQESRVFSCQIRPWSLVYPILSFSGLRHPEPLGWLRLLSVCQMAYFTLALSRCVSPFCLLNFLWGHYIHHSLPTKWAFVSWFLKVLVRRKAFGVQEKKRCQSCLVDSLAESHEKLYWNVDSLVLFIQSFV